MLKNVMQSTLQMVCMQAVVQQCTCSVLGVVFMLLNFNFLSCRFFGMYTRRYCTVPWILVVQ